MLERRKLLAEESKVRPDQLVWVEVRVEDPNFLAGVDEATRQLEEGAVAQIVGVRLEGDAEQPDLLAAEIIDEVHRGPDVLFVALGDR